MTAVFDIGKTNKKFFVFDADFREVYRTYTTFPLQVDEDGFPCEDVAALTLWLRDEFHQARSLPNLNIKALNFSGYGASFVHLDNEGKVVTPLYNYEKPYPAALEAAFYDKYGPEEEFTRLTGSPRRGMLNSGLQLYWLKHTQPEVYARIQYSLHLPQYLSWVFTGVPLSEFTSIGCHTGLWDYQKEDYHSWVYAEGIHAVLPPIVSASTSFNVDYQGQWLKIGVGIHDSSSALLPYFRSQQKPFALISTGTWSISLNPFASGRFDADTPLTDCLNYMRIDGSPVRAGSLFMGQEYADQVAWLADYFAVAEDHHKTISFDQELAETLMKNFQPRFNLKHLSKGGGKPTVLPDDWQYDTAYHQLILELVDKQCESLNAALGATAIVKLFIDGGFTANEVYLQLLANRYQGIKVRTTDASLGSALGAAIAIAPLKLGKKFLKKNFGLRKHRPFALK